MVRRILFILFFVPALVFGQSSMLQHRRGTFRAEASHSSELSAYYNLDSDWNDSVGTNNLTATGSPSHVAAKVGNGVSLNGTTQYLSHANDTAYNPTSGRFALIAWINTDKDVSDSNIQIVVVKDTASLERTFSLELAPSGSNYKFITGLTETDTTTIFAEPSPLMTVAAGTWYHMAAIADGTNLYIYINGVFKGSTSYDGTIKTGTGAFEIGHYPSVGWFFDGIIDEVGIFKDPVFSSATDRQSFANYWYNGGNGRTYTP